MRAASGEFTPLSAHTIDPASRGGGMLKVRGVDICVASVGIVPGT